MYTDTTKVQVVRAVGIGALGFGLAWFPFLGAQLFVWDDPGLLIADLVLIAVGAGMFVGARAWLASADRRNRAYLLSEHGAQVMHGRKEFDGRVVVAIRVLFVLFVVMGVAFFYYFSAAACGLRTDGFCGDVATPSDEFVTTIQLAALAVGALWAGAVFLRRTHEKESERIDAVVAEGQRRRRNDHPLAGSGRTGWE